MTIVKSNLVDPTTTRGIADLNNGNINSLMQSPEGYVHRQVGGLYLSSIDNLTTGQYSPFTLTNDRRLRVDSNLTVQDIEIGQVEIKDADSTAQANVKAANTTRAATNIVLLTQFIDAAGNVLGRTAANTARTTGTLVDPVQLIDAAGNVVNITAANTARTTGTLVLPTQLVDAAGVVNAIQGGIAAGAADSGNPVKVGGKYNATPPTLVDGQRGDMQLDVRGNAKVNTLDAFNIVKCSPTAFDGGTGNARGDNGGTSDPFTLFTVTGDVLMAVYGVCTVDLVSASAGLVSVGPVGNAALMIPATLATAIDANQNWMDGTPAIGKPIDSLNYFIVGNGVDICEDITTADVTAGNIYYICLWKALSSDGNVVSAI